MPNPTRTWGGVSTDTVIAATYTLIETIGDSATAMVWLRKTGAGGGSLGRGFYGINTADTISWLDFQWTQSEVDLRSNQSRWSSNIRIDRWTGTQPGTTWHHFTNVYSYSATGNAPSFYVDGVSSTLTNLQAATGTARAMTGRKTYIGNVQGSSRNWAGDIFGCALWNRLLSAGEVYSAYRMGPFICSTGLVLYIPIRCVSPEPNYVEGGSTGTVTGTVTTGDGPKHAWRHWF